MLISIRMNIDLTISEWGFRKETSIWFEGHTAVTSWNSLSSTEARILGGQHGLRALPPRLPPTQARPSGGIAQACLRRSSLCAPAWRSGLFRGSFDISNRYLS